MASSFSIKVRGLNELIKKFEKMPDEITDGLDATFQQAANAWVNGAVKDAPVYDGKLKGSIRQERVAFLNYRVIVGVHYAPFIEFGTKKRVQIPSGLQEIAAQYKGKGQGNFKDLLKAIEKWVRKKNIKLVGGQKAGSVRNRRGVIKRRAGSYKATAYFIALSIVKNGIKPHPFFFRQKPKAEQIIIHGFREIQKKIAL